MRRDDHGHRFIAPYIHGFQLLRLPLLNEGTAFTEGERARFGLDGPLPPRVDTLDGRIARLEICYDAIENAGDGGAGVLDARIASGAVVLVGTLVLPAGEDVVPGVVVVHGWGPETRTPVPARRPHAGEPRLRRHGSTCHRWCSSPAARRSFARTRVASPWAGSSTGRPGRAPASAWRDRAAVRDLRVRSLR